MTFVRDGGLRTRSGVRIAYRSAGAPEAEPMVLLHALGESADSWLSVLERLAENHHVLAVDLRGHGASDWPGDYAFTAMREDVIDLLDDLGQPVVLVGHSLGGTVAWLVAQAQPQRIGRLIVEDAPPPYPRDHVVPMRPDGELRFDWDVVESVVPQVNDPERRWWPGLADIAVPTLVIAGGPGSRVPQAELRRAADAVPNATLLTIAAGHHVHEEAPDLFVAAVLDWLSAD